MISSVELNDSINYIQNHPEICDVLITGGDALTLSDSQLDELLFKVRKISHVNVIRIGSRMLVNLPQRITESLIHILKQYAPIYMNTQFNHPMEITPDTVAACRLLADSGIILGNQMVLLKGVNDDKFIIQRLNEQLLNLRVRPYYIFHAKNVRGTMHFQTSITEGIEIVTHLWGNTSGLAVPRYIISAPNGMGKIEITQDTLCKKHNGSFELTTWEGIPISVPDCSE
jgi:lysine 2,3-aminomutase